MNLRAQTELLFTRCVCCFRMSALNYSNGAQWRDGCPDAGNNATILGLLERMAFVWADLFVFLFNCGSVLIGCVYGVVDVMGVRKSLACLCKVLVMMEFFLCANFDSVVFLSGLRVIRPSIGD